MRSNLRNQSTFFGLFLMKFTLLLAGLCFLPFLFADVEYSDNVAWSYNIVRDKAYLYGVSSHAPICETNDVLYIPSSLVGKPVVAIERLQVDWHTEVVIPASVTSVRCDGDWWAFSYSNDVTNRLSLISVASNNAYYKSVGGCLYTKDGRTLMRCPPGWIGKVQAASGTRFIARRAFDSCKYVTEVELPEGVLSIGERAFFSCSALRSVNLPSSLRFLDDRAFYGCSQLSGGIAIPDGIQRIGAYAFYNCAKISSVSFPDSLVEIGASAFGYCSALRSVNLPSSLRFLGDNVFYYSTNITSR